MGKVVRVLLLEEFEKLLVLVVKLFGCFVGCENWCMLWCGKGVDWWWGGEGRWMERWVEFLFVFLVIFIE